MSFQQNPSMLGLCAATILATALGCASTAPPKELLEIGRASCRERV